MTAKFQEFITHLKSFGFSGWRIIAAGFATLIVFIFVVDFFGPGAGALAMLAVALVAMYCAMLPREHRIKNAIYFDPPRPWWQRLLLVLVWVLILPFAIVFLTLYPGRTLLFGLGAVLLLFVFAIWRSRRARQRRLLERSAQ